MLLCHTSGSGMKALRARNETTLHHPCHSIIVLLPSKPLWKPLLSYSESLFRWVCSHPQSPKAERSHSSDWISSWQVAPYRSESFIREFCNCYLEKEAFLILYC